MVVPLPDASANPGTVVVVDGHADVALVAVVRSGRFHDVAGLALTEEYLLILLLSYGTLVRPESRSRSDSRTSVRRVGIGARVSLGNRLPNIHVVNQASRVPRTEAVVLISEARVLLSHNSSIYAHITASKDSNLV